MNYCTWHAPSALVFKILSEQPSFFSLFVFGVTLNRSELFHIALCESVILGCIFCYECVGASGGTSWTGVSASQT